jgi:hypothetical protein
MAEFCLETGLSPEVFWNMTLEEYAAFVAVINRRNG